MCITQVISRPRANAAALMIAFSAIACFDDDPLNAPPFNEPDQAILAIPSDSLIGDAPFLEISRELPSFSGYWFNDDDELVVGLTNSRISLRQLS